MEAEAERPATFLHERTKTMKKRDEAERPAEFTAFHSVSVYLSGVPENVLGVMLPCESESCVNSVRRRFGVHARSISRGCIFQIASASSVYSVK